MKAKEQNNLSQRVLERIENDHIEPRSKWYFASANMGFWFLWGAFTAIGALAVAAAMFALINAGWHFYAATHKNAVTFFIDSLPYLWIVGLLVFSLIAYEMFKKTRHGYRRGFWQIIAVSVVLSFIFGSLFYAFGLGEVLDDGAAHVLPVHGVKEREVMLWAHPERGTIAGEITDVDEDELFFLLDLAGKEWVVSADQLERGIDAVKEGMAVRVIGLPGEQPGEFIACVIFPWNVDVTSLRQSVELSGGGRITIFERKPAEMRITNCKDVRPYEKLKE